MISIGTGLVLLSFGMTCGFLSDPAVSVRQNEDGSVTHMVRAGRAEPVEAAKKRLLESIACPNYEIVAEGSGTDQPQQPSDLYWVRYRCPISP